MKKTLYLLVGVPGAGKSTFVKANKDNLPGSTLVISRDDIRFSLVAEGEPYFSKEKEVFNKFVADIRSGLQTHDNVVADATHISTGSRTKLLRALGSSLTDIKVVAIVLKTSAEEAIRHNMNRIGTRSFVPEETIISMSKNFSCPSIEEGFDEIEIIKKG